MEPCACETEPERSPQLPTAGLVVGVVDALWIVQQISVDGHSTLGSAAADVVGASLLHHVHPGDVTDLRTAAQTATTNGTGSALVVKVGGPGHWTPVRIVVTPMVGGDVGFAITGPQREDPHQRTSLLEQHLWRIAREIEAAGIGLVHEGEADMAALDGVEELSPRQWEVLQRLLRGERVPGIARALFLSPSTVRNHLTSIFAKVGVHSQEELIQRLRSTSRTSVPA